jgi:hypothetical protein
VIRNVSEKGLNVPKTLNNKDFFALDSYFFKVMTDLTLKIEKIWRTFSSKFVTIFPKVHNVAQSGANPTIF